VDPVRPLIDFLRSVAAEPAEHDAFRRDPEGYLASHGYEGIHRDDATDAMSLVADTLPPATAARLVTAEEPGRALDLAPGLAPGLDAGAGDEGVPDAAWGLAGDDSFGLGDLDDHPLDDLSSGHHGLGFDQETLDDVVLEDLRLHDAAAPGNELATDADRQPDVEDDTSLPWSDTDLDIGAF
jgi:hypothetical protein